MNKEELSKQYADQKVEERGEYTNCDFHRRKSLTKFDGYDIEQAFEDGLTERDKHLWKDAQGDDLPEIDREVIALIDYAGNGYYKVVFAHRPDPERKVSTSLLTGKKSYIQVKTYDKGGWNQPHVKFWMDSNLPGSKEQQKELPTPVVPTSETLEEAVLRLCPLPPCYNENQRKSKEYADSWARARDEQHGFRLGVFWKEQQTTNSAIEGFIDQIEYPGSTLIHLSENPKDFKNGDDVKVVIMKKQ